MVHVGVARDKDKVKLLDSPSLKVLLADGEIGFTRKHGREYSTAGAMVKGGTLSVIRFPCLFFVCTPCLEGGILI